MELKIISFVCVRMEVYIPELSACQKEIAAVLKKILKLTCIQGITVFCRNRCDIVSRK